MARRVAGQQIDEALLGQRTHRLVQRHQAVRQARRHAGVAQRGRGHEVLREAPRKAELLAQQARQPLACPPTGACTASKKPAA